MPIQATNYVPNLPRPDEIERGKDQTLECAVYSGADPSAPSSGTCTVYDANGAVVKTGSVTVTLSVATFALLAADTSSLDLGSAWRVEWALVMGDTRTYTFRNPAALVLRRLYPVLTDLDLTQGRYSDLSRYLPTGSTSWEAYRTSAWDEINRILLRDQRRPWLITDATAFKDVHRELTLSLIFQDLGSTQRKSGDRDWLGLATYHRDAFKSAWKQLNFDFDTDHDGRRDKRVSASPVLVLCPTGTDWRH